MNCKTKKQNAFKSLITLALVLSSLCNVAYSKQKHIGQLFDDTGSPQAGVTINVLFDGGVATLYGDSEGDTSLANPVTTGADGVYWFYADNGRYSIALDDPTTRYKVIDSEVILFDPFDPHELTASSSEEALTVTHNTTDGVGTSNTIVMKRDGSTKGPWRIAFRGKGAGAVAPRDYILSYNTELVKDASGNESWALRDAEDVCIYLRFEQGAELTTRYAVSDNDAAGTVPIFKEALYAVNGGWTFTPASYFTVGEGLSETTNYFRDRFGYTLPFPFATTFLAPPEPESEQKYGELRVLDTAGILQYSGSRGQDNPRVIAAGAGWAFFAQTGETFVKLAPGVNVAIGDALITSDTVGCAEVDNSETDVDKIVGWALENSGDTYPGYVFVVLK